MDIMNPDWMDDNVVMIASMMYIVADLDERLPPNEKKADSPFVRKDVC